MSLIYFLIFILLTTLSILCVLLANFSLNTQTAIPEKEQLIDGDLPVAAHSFSHITPENKKIFGLLPMIID